MFVVLFVDCNNEGPYYRQTQLVYYFNTCTMHLLLFCTMTYKCTIISQVITLLHRVILRELVINTLPSYQVFEMQFTIKIFHIGFMQVLIL
jgi:hypothetical protein